MRLDDRVLVGGLVAGALWLVPVLFVAWPVTVIGGAYVAVASVFLAAAYGRDRLTRRHELAAWVAPWVLLVALGGVLLMATGGEDPEGGTASFSDLVFAGLVVAALATVAYLLWQLTALAVRQVLAWFERDKDAAETQDAPAT